jgi:pyrroline-5-carboxylate reductase
MAALTVEGSARMVLDTGKHPGELKDLVTSPGGTTIVALKSLENDKFRATIMNAMEAGTKRVEQMMKGQQP